MIISWLTSKLGRDRAYPEWRHSRGWTFHVVGEGEFQDNLLRIAGPKGESGKRHYCEALLIADEHFRTGPNAIAVEISGLQVGFLHESYVEAYQGSLEKHGIKGPVKCKAVIVGGWLREADEYGGYYDEETDEYVEDKGSEGSFGVRLNIKWPPVLK